MACYPNVTLRLFSGLWLTWRYFTFWFSQYLKLWHLNSYNGITHSVGLTSSQSHMAFVFFELFCLLGNNDGVMEKANEVIKWMV